MSYSDNHIKKSDGQHNGSCGKGLKQGIFNCIGKFLSRYEILLHNLYYGFPIGSYSARRHLIMALHNRLSIFTQQTLSHQLHHLPGKNHMAEIEQYIRTDINMDKTPLVFYPSEFPLISIIIPVYGQIEHTVRCLTSICNTRSHIPFEIIAMDDASPDETASVLKRVIGVRLVRNTINAGFIKNSNAGADMAKGDYLLFLNKDTIVMPGWLDALVETFTRHPDVGLAVAALLHPDGVLQEAGGVVFRDGATFNIGRNEASDKQCYTQLREVDYCSGGCMMMPKKIFDQVGGFDEKYEFGYYEDVDIAFSVRKIENNSLSAARKSGPFRKRHLDLDAGQPDKSVSNQKRQTVCQKMACRAAGSSEPIIPAGIISDNVLSLQSISS